MLFSMSLALAPTEPFGSLASTRCHSKSGNLLVTRRAGNDKCCEQVKEVVVFQGDCDIVGDGPGPV